MRKDREWGSNKLGKTYKFIDLRSAHPKLYKENIPKPIIVKVLKKQHKDTMNS